MGGYLLDGPSLMRIRRTINEWERQPKDERSRRSRVNPGRWQTLLHLCELTGTLTAGGSVSAKRKKWNDAWVDDTEVGTLTLFDSVGTFQGVPGDLAWCFRSHRSKRMEIISLDGDAAPDVVYFELIDNLSQGESGAAYVRAWDGAWQTTAAEVEVFDNTRLGPAPFGAYGQAWLSPQSGRLEIIALEDQEFELVPFYLNEDVSKGGSASAQIREWSGSWTPGADAIEVHDSNELGPATATQVGTCYYNEESLRYEIISLEDNALDLVPFYLNEDLAEGESAESQILEWNGTDWNPSAGDPIEVNDFLELGPATATRRGVAYFNGDSERYEILNVDSVKLFWAKATTKWTNLPGNGSYVLCHKALDKEGTLDLLDDEPQDITVYLPRPGGNVDPNVRTGDVIGYEIDRNNLAIATTDYLDDAIGTVTMWARDEAEIRGGWRIYSVSSGRFPVGCTSSDEDIAATAPGTTGGEKQHIHDYEMLEIATFETELTIEDHSGIETQATELTLLPHIGYYTEEAGVVVEPNEEHTAYISGETDNTSPGVTGTGVAEVSGTGTASTSSTSLTTEPGGGGSATLSGTTGDNITLGFQILDHENHWHQADATAIVQAWSSGTVRYGHSVSSPQPTTVAQSSGGQHLSHSITDLKHRHALNSTVTLSSHTHTINSHNHTVSIADIAAGLTVDGSEIAALLTVASHNHGFTDVPVTIPAHTHETTPHFHAIPSMEHSLSPNPHNHGVNDLEHELTPNPHDHKMRNTPPAKHIPPWFGINFIERYE